MKRKDFENLLHHPHDSYFKKTFGKKEIATDFLKNYLPKEMLEIINLDTLTNQKGEYIDKKLKNDFSDLLYQVEINGKKGFIYILFEHKSNKDEKVVFQLLRYMTKIWEEKFDNHSKSVPAIIPLLIYHGNSKWVIKNQLWQYIQGINEIPSQLQKMIPDYLFMAYDYSPKGELQIKGNALLKAVLMMFKGIREKDKHKFIESYKEFVSLIEQITDIQKANELFELTIFYLLNVKKDIEEEDLIKASIERSDIVQSVAQKLIEKGKIETAINFYKMGLTIEQISQGTEIPIDKLKEILKNIDR